MGDQTVKGGTGWGAEFAKLCNKPLFVFDQERDRWFRWSGDEWMPIWTNEPPVIAHPHFTGTGTRHLSDNGKRAIKEGLKAGERIIVKGQQRVRAGAAVTAKPARSSRSSLAKK